ncbi:alpha amylase C-terminal domain-containing protein [Corynebacterium glyciniphilum]|uniref:alpha amylase C-terminal domain-containing protein n=1 Tax=Corynebacterium glyciniphilum TaxID=1404244 RepID=UPI00264ECADE|nr:alpha amylase C-terminal domain-containing protein [Corynebacterium glyciniphilum]MDN6706367.1 alpha amylase C-terminal domain-containing protein [Corynebacterium glyciniphilum]
MSDLVLGPVVGKLGGGELNFSPSEPTNEVKVELPDGIWIVVVNAKKKRYGQDYIAINGKQASAKTSETNAEMTGAAHGCTGTVTVTVKDRYSDILTAFAFPDPTT